MEQKEGPSFGKGETRPAPPRDLTPAQKEKLGDIAIKGATQDKK